jgi:hypothetical protein
MWIWIIFIIIVSGGIALVVGLILLLLAYIINYIVIYFGPEKTNKRKQERLIYEEKEQFIQAEKLREKQQIKEKEYNQRCQIRKRIEIIPRYNHWRKAVFEKFGKKCEICNSVKDIEVHHRKSFDAIIKENNITNIIQAYEYDALWNVNNGSPLCKLCHEKTKSSIYRKESNIK